jgi:hypothetical protein
MEQTTLKLNDTQSKATDSNEQDLACLRELLPIADSLGLEKDHVKKICDYYGVGKVTGLIIAEIKRAQGKEKYLNDKIKKQNKLLQGDIVDLLQNLVRRDKK